MWGFLANLLLGLVRTYFGVKQQTATDNAREAGASEQKLRDQENAGAITAKAAAARRDADVDGMLRSGDAGTVDAKPESAINQDPNGHYRD